MRILYISRHNPFGTTGGGDMASHAYLKAFSRLSGGDIDVCIASHIQEADAEIRTRSIYRVPPRDMLHKCLSVFTGETHRYTAFVKALLKRNTDYDICVFDHSSIAGTLVRYVNALNIKTVTIHHNFEAAYYRDNSGSVERALFLRHVKACEKIAYKESAWNLFLSDSDRKQFSKYYGDSRGRNEIIGVFNYYNETLDFRERNNDLEHLTFAITGTMSNYQTVDGVVDYLNSYHAMLPSGASLIIAGRNPAEDIYKAAARYDNVRIVANPENMQDVLLDADVYICPIKLGSGVKLRVLDAVKAGLPSLCHEVSYRGYELFDDTCLVEYRNPDEFAAALTRMLNHMKNKECTAAAFREAYEKTFTFEAGLRRLQSIML